MAPNLATHHPTSNLTPRERQIIVLVAEGRSNDEIANQLGISSHVVKFHLANAGKKFGTGSRVAMAVQAVRQGWA